jgi:transposase
MNRKEESVMESTTIAVDLAKSVFQIAVSHHPGKVASSQRLSRSGLLRFLAQQPPARVLLEACGSSHHWARQLQQLGHEVVLLPPHAVRRYVRRDKTDAADAKALLEAARNEEILPVPVKSLAQQTMASVHRMRSAWMAERVARLNLLRGLLRELGVLIPVGAGQVLVRVRAELAEPAGEIPAPLHPLLREACEEIEQLQRRIRMAEKQLAALGAQTPVVGRLRSIPGIGLLSATALVAFLGNVERFATCRHLASFLGLTAREHSSGSRRHLGRITKCGDRYLRYLLIHGARAVLSAASRCQHPDRLGAWALQVQQRRGSNKATVALANKLARIVWSVWRHDTVFQSRPGTA